MNHKQLIEYFSKVMQTIFLKLGSAKNLDSDKASQKLIGDILTLINTMGIKSSEVMPIELEKAYREAVDNAEKDLKAQNVRLKEIDPLDLLKKKIHLAAVKKLVNNTMTDIRKSITRAKADAKVKISRVVERVREDLSKGLIKGTLNKVMSRRLTKMFVEEGITGFVTSDNKNIRVEKYAATVVRTKLREANTQGNVNRYKEADVNLVKISSHHPSCGKCARYAGKVVSLTGEHKGFMSVKDIPLPPFHPNCRHTTAPYVIEYKTEEEIQQAKNDWKSFQPNQEVRTAAQQNAYKKEQDIRRKANDEQKQYEKYKAVLGDKAPKTIGAFRRIKRAGGKSYKELQLAFRRGNAELKA